MKTECKRGNHRVPRKKNETANQEEQEELPLAGELKGWAVSPETLGELSLTVGCS